MKTILFSILLLVVAYLFGAFYSVSFNIKDWTERTRLGILIFYFLIEIIFLFIRGYLADKNNL